MSLMIAVRTGGILTNGESWMLEPARMAVNATASTQSKTLPMGSSQCEQHVVGVATMPALEGMYAREFSTWQNQSTTTWS